MMSSGRADGRAEVTACRPGELPELLELVNRVFRSARPGEMGAEYPLLFDPQNLEQLRVIREGGRIAAHVGICLRDASLLGAPVRVASIGSVCTDPDRRGRGHASALMADAAAHSRRRGASLMLISGGRGLYRRLGYVPAGRFTRRAAPAGAAPGDVQLAPAGEPDLGAVIALHQREPVRFVRTREDWRRLLQAGMLMNAPAELLLLRRSGQVVGYLGTRLPGRGPGRPESPEVAEFAGSRPAAAAALPAVARRYGAAAADLVAHADDVEWELAAGERGWPAAPLTFPGTLGILDPPVFLEAVRSCLEERLGRDLAGVTVEAGRAGWTLTMGAARADAAGPGPLAALLFGRMAGPGEANPPAPAASLPGLPPEIAEALSPALPLPLLWPGYNYV